MKTILLHERADFAKYSKIWSKELFDKIIVIDPSPDKRYETWLLDTFRKEIGGFFKVNPILKNFTLNSTSEQKEFTSRFNDIFLQNMFLDKSFYEHSSSWWADDILKKIKVNNPELIKSLMDSLSHTPPLRLSNIFMRYIETNEDTPALIRDLSIHRWLSDANRLPTNQKNISNFRTIKSLGDAMSPYYQEYAEVEEQLMIGTRVKSGVDYNLILEDKNSEGDSVVIVKINSFTGSQYWGKGTNWCIISSSTLLDRYTNNKKASCIYYIIIKPDKTKIKLAFVEGDKSLLKNVQSYDGVQYRTPNNKELTFGQIKSLVSEKHQQILAKYFWIFEFMLGQVKQIEGGKEVQEFETVGDALKALNSDDRNDVMQDFYEEASDAYYSSDESVMPEKEIENYINEDPEELEKIEDPNEWEEAKECTACEGTGYAFTEKWGKEGYQSNELSIGEYKNILSALGGKEGNSQYNFRQIYVLIRGEEYSEETETNFVKSGSGKEPDYYELRNKKDMIEIAKKYNNECARCNGTGEPQPGEMIKERYTWSGNQIEIAQESWDKEAIDDFERKYTYKIESTDWDKAPEDLKSDILDKLGISGTLDYKDIKSDTRTERIGNALVRAKGIHPASQMRNVTPTQKAIERLLRKFK